MKFYLGGGRSVNQGESAVQAMYNCIEHITRKENTTQILHIPFARTGIMNYNRSTFLPTNFSSYVENLGIEYLNATYIEEIERFSGDTIYINGGNSCEFLLEMCKQEILFAALQCARVIIGESCGAMVMGDYFVKDRQDNLLAKGLGFVANTIIEPHYTERERHETLQRSLDKLHTHGLGIDECTFVEYENGEYGEVIGKGKVFHF